ncbi:hypothetical protein JSW74_001735 [Campylobacter jejuni]|uniref:Periplasmic protein n=1 Tax=Campylobacter jejuni TaxID=197 RepID=A0AAW5EHZ5_CAMJU|nr:hypothetical protein [Campylobacter jejuni]AXL42330.1 hypothetical protein AEI20_06130 [Campylobacter jejuni]EAH5019714.1 hypothetical protein [Campylobacter jejuni]EAH5385823.1 hypothetical protein [Campylobacter jejuni]EAH5734022.1 hypothetical protein [Campylobacter jejuni]EAH6498671.1 hypothetical protein [Campylobacter jejuni]
MVIFKNILLFLFFSTYLLAQEDFTPLEQYTYENEKFWIKILNLCPEGNITCDKVVYVGVNKNNGKYIVLNGKSISDVNMNFKGYVFKNGIYEYNIFNNFLYISKNKQIIQEYRLKLCEK